VSPVEPDPPFTPPAKFLEWASEYSVLVREIDAEHQCLFAMIDGLHEAMLTERDLNRLGGLLQELNHYVASHFAHEEALMAACGYPGREAHMQQHDALHRRSKTLAERFDRGEVSTTTELTLLLSEWLRNHILAADQRFGEYLRQQRITFTGYGSNIEIPATPAAPDSTQSGAFSSLIPPSA